MRLSPLVTGVDELETGNTAYNERDIEKKYTFLNVDEIITIITSGSDEDFEANKNNIALSFIWDLPPEYKIEVLQRCIGDHYERLQILADRPEKVLENLLPEHPES